MYITEATRRDWQARYGHPRLLEIQLEISPEEREMVRRSRKAGRSHDITLLIFQGAELVLIKKPFFPAGAYRAPSGGLLPGESLEAGVRREAYEETGLEIELEAYLVHMRARFTCRGAVENWISDVFAARALDERLCAHDTEEIAEVRWGTLEELQGPIRRTLLETGWPLFRYRVLLTDAAVEVLGKLGLTHRDRSK
jgi:8-oxo-dGTP pyrophosphatase MutT (NUDIX family)